MRSSRLASLLAALWLGACSTANFDLPGAAGDDAAYAALFPYFAEFCAVSQIKKKLGFGADIRGQIGGHAVFYLNGACRVPDAGYPVLQLCQPGQEDGVGLSMNEHFRNAKWVATPGHAFFFDGGAPEAGGLTRAGYARTQAEAKRLGIYDGVVFHDKVFEMIAPGWSREDWKYEVSVATDYGISLGRGRYCARVPVTRAQMARMVTFLNEQNAPYRAGKMFEWSVFRDNCIHLAHNALAVAGLWDEWPINRFIGFAVFDFPVPMNEFVNLMRRTNDAWPPDPDALYRDDAARQSLLTFDQLPTRPGALALARPPQRPNAVYETDLKLIFYDEPNIGSYQPWFDEIFGDPRYLNLRANAAWFAGVYRRAEAARASLEWWTAHGHSEPDFPAVYEAYYAHIARARAEEEDLLAQPARPLLR